jgi:hypothetical protein
MISRRWQCRAVRCGSMLPGAAGGWPCKFVSELRRGKARSSRETAGSSAPPRDRCGAGMAAGSLGTLSDGSIGHAAGTGPSRSGLRVTDRGAGSDHTGRACKGRPARYIRRSSSEKFCGNELGLAWPMHGRTGNGWVDRQPRPYTPRKSGNCIVPVLANPRSLVECRSGAPQSAESWEQSHEKAQARPCAGGPHSKTKLSSMPVRMSRQ